MKKDNLINKTEEGYKKEFNEISDDSVFLDQLKEINNEKRKPLLLFWFSKPIPAYSLALTGLLFFLLLFTFKPKTTELIVYRDAETVIKYDTIVVRDTVKIENSIDNLQEKNFVKYSPKQSKKNISTPIVKAVNNSEFYFDKNQVNEQQTLTGTSSADSELAQFLGVNI